MQSKESRGLLAVFTDVDQDFLTEFERWHNCELIAERVSVPGFLAGHRYHGTGKASEFLFLYETADFKVLGSEPYLNILNNPTPWSREAIPHLKVSSRTIYTLLASAGNGSPLTAGFLLAWRFDSQPGGEQEIINWYRDSFLPAIVRLPGVYRGRLYESRPELSQIPTTERKLHGSGPAKQRFLGLYEISSRDFGESKAWQGFKAGAEQKKSMKNQMLDLKEEFYWLHFTMVSAENR